MGVRTMEEAVAAAEESGYPVLLRPSYVIGGQNMTISRSRAQTVDYMTRILSGGIENPVLVDQYLPGIELEAGDIVQFSAQLKWGDDINNSGLFWLNVVKDEPAPNDPNILVQFFNYWGEYTDDQGVLHSGPSVPAYDGDLTGSANYSQGDEWGFSSPVDALGEGMGVCYTAEESGTYYVVFELRNVWSVAYYGKPYFIDEVSAKVVGQAE